MAKKLQIGVIITLAMLFGGVYYIAQDDDAFYCESRDIVMICEKLSSGIGTRCYHEDTYKICKEGWQKLESTQGLTIGIHVKEGNKWLCAPEGCEVIK